MKEIPLLLNGDMVRAEREGRKTQTRRPIRTQPPDDRYSICTLVSNSDNRRNEGKMHWCIVEGLRIVEDQKKYFTNPLGSPGDLLWVRERARVIDDTTDYLKEQWLRFCYESDGVESGWIIKPKRVKPIKTGHCVPNGCYKEAARTWLKVTGVRVERVQGISESDAISEGVTGGGAHPDFWAGAFRDVWDCIYPGSWDRNDWVFATEFERITR